MSGLTTGIVLALVAGILNGSFAAPTKYAKAWKWENIWAVWAVTGMLVFPWLIVIATVPDAGSIYRSAGARSLLLPIGFGVGFGLAQIFFGLGIAAVGIALNFAIAIGLSTALGSLVPLVILQRQKIFTSQGKMIFAGVGLILAGIVGCALAGKMKEKTTASEPPRESSARPMNFGTGLLICILAGIGSPLINFGLAFGAPLIERAAAQGAGPGSKANVLWAPLVTASLLPYLIYCAHLWRKNQTWSLYRAKGTSLNWFLGAAMGLLWFGSTVIYGGASARMSSMGPILGWPLFMSAIILTSNVWGFATGEWKGAGGKALAIMLLGILLLILGFVTLALAGRLG
jgi:L-rhamnose-H+ transport protein